MYKKPLYHKWYGLARWKKVRRRQLAKEPICVMCKAEGFIKPATVCDHVIEHKGDPILFWDEENLQSLCKRHHDSDKQSFEKGGSPKIRVDANGWPITDIM